MITNYNFQIQFSSLNLTKALLGWSETEIALFRLHVVIECAQWDENLLPQKSARCKRERVVNKSAL